ncbi:MAG TPA: TonB-dependent receptor [Candidatus Cybelea sp.]|jgi:outer membrane receptor protein involved in Fe transport|nr:TonB-dependent receptor [Candidatus Cybelea sp.]
MSRIFAALVAALLGLSCVLPAAAAVSGLVRGTVTLDGKPVAGATVTLEGEGSKFVTKSAADGGYVFSQAPFGNYRVTATLSGITPLAVDVTVTSGLVATVDLPLTRLKQIAQTTVTAHAGVTSYPPSVHQIDRDQIQTSPAQNSLDQTLETLPGVVPFSYNEPVINGFHGVTYNIDGAPLPLATTSNFAEIIDPKIIDSLEVYTGAIPAEYGGDRMGGVVNIISNRPTDFAPGVYGIVEGGIGNQSQGVGQLEAAARFGQSEVFLDANTQSTARGLDAPTFNAIHDDSSQSDQFFRFITQLTPRSTLAFDYSNQLAQFQIPINVDPNNPFDPIYTPAGTDDVQREYDRFSNLNYTLTSKDGNGIWQIIPWWRSTRINYDGDLYNDVLGITPNFSADSLCFDCGAPMDGSGSGSGQLHNVGLLSNTYASYYGLRASDFRATKNHAWKIGIDANKSFSLASQAFACYYEEGCGATSGTHDQPYYLIAPGEQGQAGSQIGIYAQDSWQLSKYALFNYGVRYDHSTGYTSGNMIEPRLGLNLWDGGKNTYHVFYGRFYAAPLLEDVRQDCVLLAGCTGEPVYDLKPEQDAYFEMGWQYAFNPAFTGSINLFRKTVVNILDTTQLLNTPLFAVFNNAIGIDNGVELRLQDRLPNNDLWWFTTTYSGSYAACVSGSTFLFPPNTNEPGVSCVAQLSPEDHDETVVSSGAYTWRFGKGGNWFTTLQGNYGSGFPVAFESANANLSGRLPAHTTFDIAAGRNLVLGRPGEDKGLGIQLIVNNILNHQYVIKVANGFNTTQISNGTNFLLRLSAPF